MEIERRTFLRDVEELDRERLEALQSRKLAAQVERLHATNRFYANRWREAGVDPASVRSRDDLQRLPFTTKEDVLADQERVPPYGDRLGVPLDDVYELTLTSGTSGRAKEVHAHTEADARKRGALSAMAWSWAGLRTGDIAAAHVAANNAASLWCMDRGIRAIGRMPYLVGHLSFDERLETMAQFGVDLLFAMPSALNGLAASCQALGAEPSEMFPGLRSIITSGESWPVAWIERMESVWGARIYEVYGSTQTYAAFGAACCERGALVDGRRGFNHLFEWTTLYEVLDPVTLETAVPGERGELVITHLDKEASPLVRFRTGDVVRWFEAGTCPCGRAAISIEAGTVGRFDDMLKLRGQNVWTADVDALVFTHVEVDEFQVDVTIAPNGREQLDLRIGLHPGAAIDSDSFAAKLTSELKHATALRFDVRVVPRDSLPHFDSPDKKARRWHDRRHEGLAGARQ
jgi:phenylacetate-CoA ligase